MKSNRNILALSLLAFLVIQSTGAQTLRPADSLEYAFALSSFGGDQAVIYNYFEFEPPKELFAVRSNGSICKLTFLRHKREQGASRITPENFEQVGGPVYQSKDRCLPDGMTAFLAGSTFLKSNKPISVNQPSSGQLTKEDIRRIERTKGLKIRTQWQIASIAGSGNIALTIFEPRNDTILLSLVLITKKKLVFKDFPGSASDESSTWRVDDGGDFQREYFEIIAALRSKHGIVLVATWEGFEGEYSLVLLEDGTTFRAIGDGSRYWAPE